MHTITPKPMNPKHYIIGNLSQHNQFVQGNKKKYGQNSLVTKKKEERNGIRKFNEK